MYIDEYQSSLNKGTYGKLKKEAKNAFIIYGVSTILSKILTLIFYPFLFIICKIGHEVYKLSERLIPKKVDELVDEYNKDIDNTRIEEDKKELERELQRLFLEWKKGGKK
jgi:hypothetical protein